MSIQFRLNAAIGALLALALLWIVGTMIYEAGPRVRAESASIMRLSKGLVEPSIRALSEAKDPEAAFRALLDDLKDVRHVRMTLEGAGPGHVEIAGPPPEPKQSWFKRWLARLIPLQPEVERLPVDIPGRHLGDLVLTSKPVDEVDEVLNEIGDVALRGLMLAAAVFALTTLVVNRALQPVDRLSRALGAMQGGDYDIALPEHGPPEIAAISGRLNALARTLTDTRKENRWLSEKVIRVADEERRELARELHDELGPYLFAVRAGTTSLRNEAQSKHPDVGRMAALCTTLLEQIDALQRTNRRVLVKLRPVGLAELGLVRALEALVSLWSGDHPDVAVALDIAADVTALDDTSALTAYRVVQEGLTNAFRHAGATRIDVRIATDPTLQTAACAVDGPLIISVRDNGAGLPEESHPGFGITGMNERLWALGGDMRLVNAPGGGVLLEAVVPVARK